MLSIVTRVILSELFSVLNFKITCIVIIQLVNILVEISQAGIKSYMTHNALQKKKKKNKKTNNT